MTSPCVCVEYRQLQCDRVTLHNHLFTSYILSALAWICYYTHDDSPWAAPQRACVWICYYTQAALDAVVIANNPV